MERILPLLKGGVSARFAFLSDGMDPDDLIRAKGKEAFDEVLAKAVPLSDMIWRTLTGGRKFDTPESRAGLQRAIENVVNTIADRSVQKQYQANLKDRFFKTFVQRGPAGGRPKTETVRLPDPKTRGRNERARVALAAILSFPEIFHDAEDLLGRLVIDDPRLDAMRQAVMGVLSDQPDMDHDALVQYMENAGFSEDVKAIQAAARMHGTSARGGSTPIQALEGLKEAVAAQR
jgi:DNA primase